ncbi:MAG: polyprenol monophosphomannose synthase [Kiritimatiellia bacterium]|nr:polyprenol monophosphomannose synthase [Lentisphaerota bacterium]
MSKTLVVIPTYNEADNVREIADRVLASAAVHLLFVDDNSPDGTGRMLNDLAARDDRVHVLHRPEKAGLGRAYIAGFKWALDRDYDLVMEMDADLSHNPDDIPRFLGAAAAADLVLGSRYINGIRIINWPLERLILSKAASLYVRLITGMPFSDPTGGFKCFRRAVLEAIDLEHIRSNGYSFQIEMTHSAWMKGFRITEIPIIFEDRRSGCSKMQSAIVREALWMVVKLGFRRPARGGSGNGGRPAHG